VIVVAKRLQLLDGSSKIIAIVDRRIGRAVTLSKCGVVKRDCLLVFFLVLWVDLAGVDLVSGPGPLAAGGSPPPPPPAAKAGMTEGAVTSAIKKTASVTNLIASLIMRTSCFPV
jgi:hypothetical protein